MAVYPPDIWPIVRKFLKYSLEPINYRYDELTSDEKALCSRKMFDKLVEFTKGRR